MEHRIVRFHGSVQGVGFRYTVERLARRFPGVTGQVFNESNHVTLDIEGEATDLTAFVAEILASLPASARIESTQTVTLPACAGQRGFHIGSTRS
jgi:hydrogenase maturation factor HypF (carbamoyltransferase family)